MKKSDEILKLLNEKIEACGNLQGEEKVAMYNEVKAMKQDYEIQVDLEKEEIKQVENKIENKVEIRKDDVKMEKQISVLNAMIKNVKGDRLTQEEADVLNKAKVMNAVTGSEHIEIKELSTAIKELLRQEEGLKDLVTIHKTVAATGAFPIDKCLRDIDLVKIVDGTKMVADTDLSFDSVQFAMEKFGKLGHLTDTVLKYTTADLIAFMARQFVRAYVNNLNKRIVKKCMFEADGTTAKPKTTIAKVDELAKACRNGLDTALQAEQVVLMNQEAFEVFIADKKQDQISYIQPNIAEKPIPVVNGTAIKVVSKRTLPNFAEGTTSPVIIANFKEYLQLFENEEYTISLSKEAGYLENVVYSKIVCYNDLQVVDEEAMKLYEVTL